jgi:Sulfotransferase domain
MLMSDIDFLIIGAAKSATTWLQFSLKCDPAVVMPDRDLEIHYFSREFARGDQWYFSHFAKKTDGQILGERSNSYLDTPNVAARIHAAIPNARLIAQLRNPLDRAYSDYCMLYRRGEVGPDIKTYLDPRVAANNRFLMGGRYQSQLAAYLAVYPATKLLVTLYEEMKEDPVRQLAQVHNFLGLASPSLTLTTIAKDKTTPTVKPELKKYLHWLKPYVLPLRRTHAFQKLRNAVVTEIKYPELSSDLRERMADFYEPEIQALEKMLGKDLACWQR